MGWDTSYSRHQWEKLRTFVLNCNDHRCTIQGPGCTGKANHVHHTLGASITGIITDPQWLTSSCATCNKKLGQPTNETLTHKAMTKW